MRFDLYSVQRGLHWNRRLPAVELLEDRTVPSFVTSARFDAGTNPTATAVGDLNGDGNLDIITSDQVNNRISVMLGNGDSTFGAPIQSTTGGVELNHLLVADLNRDGNLDVV